jgi:hypothetical protein
MLLSQLALARALVERAEATVAVGDEGTHPSWFGEGQRVAVVSFAPVSIEPFRVSLNIAQ